MFSFIKQHLTALYTNVTSKFAGFFAASSLDAQTFKQLEAVLIQADMGVATTRRVLENLNNNFQAGKLATGAALQQALKAELLSVVATAQALPTDATVFLLVGINGSGKTTFISKLAHQHATQGKKVLLVAGDTFRAAAIEQLATWSSRLSIPIVTGNPNQDPSSVIFKGCAQFAQGDQDILIIDTAGRLQTKSNLMKELEKIKKTISRQLPDKKICTLLTIDAMLGQNSLEQARNFHESTIVDGIVLTKMDGTAKGGAVFAIAHELKLPIAYITYGEDLDALKKFDPHEFVDDLLHIS